jgi:hypothetical protein
MYKIIGADGKEYGPISAEVLRQWIAEGRANAQSKILPEGATEWKALSEFPEFMAPSTPGAPAPLSAMPSSAPVALDQVNGPAIGLIITAILGFLAQAVSLVMRLAGASFMAAQHNAPPWAAALSGTVGVVASIIGIIMSLLIIAGGLNMKKLTNYPLALTASIIAMIPCISPCCLLGLPIGIWALVVLSKTEVKSAFH